MKTNFRTSPPPPQVFRVCAICGRRHAPTYGFRQTLEYYGIKGDKAAVECVRNLHRTHPQPKSAK
jgi:hypothetical protein